MIPKKLQSALWSYDLKTIDPKRHKKLIITQVLNFGTWEQVQWLIKYYSKKDLRNAIKEPARGVWRADSLNYWTLLLDVKVSKLKARRAIFSLDPKFQRNKRTHNA